MKRLLIASVTLGASLALLSGCETGPPPVRTVIAPPPPPVVVNPLTQAAEREAMLKFGGTALKPGDYRMLPATAIPAKGTVNILVSLRNQRTYVYKAGQLIAISSHSHGTADHPTDPGQFKILGKKVFHRSNKYSNAPMPHMQRLDKWGRAFHGGVVPGYPASHGCIRLPPKMAKALYGLTKVGDVVEIEA